MGHGEREGGGWDMEKGREEDGTWRKGGRRMECGEREEGGWDVEKGREEDGT